VTAYVTVVLVGDALRRRLSLGEDESFAVIGVDGDRHAMVCLGSDIPTDTYPMDYARKLAANEGLPFYKPRDVFRFSLYAGAWGAVDGEPCRCRDCRDDMADSRISASPLVNVDFTPLQQRRAAA
jgi:hypothetical protein